VQDYFTGRNPADKRIKRDDKGMVPVHMGLQRQRYVKGDADLLSHFAVQALFRRFARFDLAAGKFPLQRHLHSVASLGAEDVTLVFYDGAGDMYLFHGKYLASTRLSPLNISIFRPAAIVA
jgi:hypothetical protein